LSNERVERRLAAILAADVAGYSRLMGANEEGTLAQLKAIRNALVDPTIAANRGRIVKTTGDGMLVEFASAVDAARCAVEVQRGMMAHSADVAQDLRIEFRIGIHVGDIIIDDNDMFGDGVNIAARLEGIAEPGGVCISDDAYRQIRGKVDIVFDDTGPQSLKNIAELVHTWRCRIDANSSSATPTKPAVGAAQALPDKPSIAVLPFQNMTGDPEQEYFSDGITEDIITELSRFRSLFVVARNSSFSLRGKTVNVTEVGRRLGVRYVVEGSVRKAGKRVRVAVQLLDAASGNHLWAERYDRELEDIFFVQDEITRAVVATLPGRLEDAGRDLAKRKQTSNVTAYDLVLLGNERWRRLTQKDLTEALGYFRSAVVLDPHYARAHANIAWTHVCDVFLEAADATSLDEASRHIEMALDIDDGDAWSHGVFAQLLFLLRKDDEAEIHFKRALALNPNDADVAAVFANILVYWGRWREALTWLDAAKRLNPLPPNLYHWYHALALYSGREYEQAVSALKEMRPLDRWSHGLLAACYAQAGRHDEARSESEAFISERQRELKERGEAPPRSRLDLGLARAERYRDPLDREHFLEGLRKAGLTG
jgi:adenylate cyclase